MHPVLCGFEPGSSKKRADCEVWAVQDGADALENDGHGQDRLQDIDADEFEDDGLDEYGDMYEDVDGDFYEDEYGDGDDF